MLAIGQVIQLGEVNFSQCKENL